MTNTNLAADPLRVETLTLLEQTATRFSDLVQDLSAEEWDALPGENEWSLSQTSEHITLVEVGSGKLIARKLFLEPATDAALAEANGKDALLRATLLDRVRFRREAPDFVKPVGTWKSRDELLSAFWQWRGSTIAMLSDPARDPSRYVAQHPVFGPVDGRCWGLFLALHLQRHLEQMRVIRGL